MPRTRSAAAVTFALTIVACGMSSCIQEGAAGQVDDGLAVLPPPPDPNLVARPMTPFGLENLAHVVAYATMGQVFEHDGRRLIKLQIDRVLKGPTAPDTLAAGDSMPDFGCIPPNEPLSPSSLFAPGTKVLVYIAKGRSWSIVSIQRLNLEIAELLAERITRYAVVEGAALAPDPVRRYQELLAPEAGGLDEPAYWVLRHNPQRSALPALMMQLDRAVDATKRGPGIADVAITRLAHVFTFMEATEALGPLLIAAPRLTRDNRVSVYPYLHRLASKGSEVERLGLKAVLLKDLDDPALATNAWHYKTVVRTLGKNADRAIITRLLSEQNKHKADGVGGAVPSALISAMSTASEVDRDRIIRSWVAIVEEYQGLENARSPQRTTLRHVLNALVHAAIDPTARERLDQVRRANRGSWYDADLSAILN